VTKALMGGARFPQPTADSQEPEESWEKEGTEARSSALTPNRVLSILR
jgi:hypothetical protein